VEAGLPQTHVPVEDFLIRKIALFHKLENFLFGEEVSCISHGFILILGASLHAERKNRTRRISDR